jgi:hypothetical protein
MAKTWDEMMQGRDVVRHFVVFLSQEVLHQTRLRRPRKRYHQRHDFLREESAPKGVMGVLCLPRPLLCFGGGSFGFFPCGCGGVFRNRRYAALRPARDLVVEQIIFIAHPTEPT